LTKNWQRRAFVWMPYRLQTVDEYNKSESRFMIKDNCEVCENSTIIKELDHENDNGEKCQNLIPDKSFRNKNGNLEKLCTVAYVAPEKGNITDFVRHVTKHRKWKMKDVILKVGMDYGQSTLKIMLQIFSTKYRESFTNF